MAYVLVNKKTRVRHANLPRNGGAYKTQAAAQAAITRNKQGRMALGDAWQVMSMEAYEAQVPMITVKNLMSGKPVQIRADTPWHCRPDSESYWSM